jgi:hypothetical protein
MVLDENGKVGIGRTDPEQLLDVAGTSKNTISGAAAATTAYQIYSTTANHYNGNTSTTYLMSGLSGYLTLATKTTRTDGDACIMWGTNSDISEIVSVTTDGSDMMPLNFRGSSFLFTGGVTEFRGTANVYSAVANNNGGSTFYVSNQGSGNNYAVMYLSSLGANCYWFLNSQDRSADGGVRTATLRNDNGALRLQAEGDVRGIYISGGGYVSIGKNDGNSSGILNIWNPSGGVTHFGWTDNGNYIRGNFTNIDNVLSVNTGANQNFLTLYANSSNSNEYINLRFSHQGTSTYIQSYRISGFWRTYLIFKTVNSVGNNVDMFQITDQGIQGFGNFYTPGNAWCGDVTVLGNGCSSFSQGWDRCLIYANGYNTGGGYFYYNQNNVYGTISDRRIKKDFEIINENQSITFIKALEPTSFCLKEQSPCCRKKINEKGEEVEEEICPAVCSCRQDGWIAQNVLQACELSGVNKSVINHWYDYEQELNKPEEERKTLIGVSDRPILSHAVNTIKYLLNENDSLNQRVKQLEDIVTKQNDLLKQIIDRLK